ncbi:MAG: hypothetical protein KAQ92_05620 [Candidatus Aenigmarchaeota archaeon]|nr:hypothetical protein [Candidatus Aenigmarchaeota archaeon]
MNKKGGVKLMIGLLIAVLVVGFSAWFLYNSQKTVETTVDDSEEQINESASNACLSECFILFRDNNGEVTGSCTSEDPPIPCDKVLLSKGFE